MAKNVLNNTEIAKALGGWDFVRLDMQRVCARQRALTLRAVAEWLDGGCEHDAEKLRVFCESCLMSLRHALRQGRMPGGENK